MSTDSIGAWIAISSSILAGALALYGVWQAWQQNRLSQSKRLSTAATVAVRRTEAVYVRPTLLLKFTNTLERWMGRGSASPSLTEIERMHLYCELCREVKLTGEEKQQANTMAITTLREALATMVSTPMVISDPIRPREQHRLAELVEEAYQLRPRVSASVVHEFNQFCPSTSRNKKGDGMGPSNNHYHHTPA